MGTYKYLFIFLLLLPLALFVPLVFETEANESPKGETNNPGKIGTVEKIKEKEEQQEKVNDQNEANEARLDQVHYKGELYRDAETHYYLFTTTKVGTIHVEWGENTIGSDFIITNQNWETLYFNGDLLPAGSYMFVITTNPAETPSDSDMIRYDFKVLGLTFHEPPDTTLPTLNVESPAQVVNTLGEGEHTVTFKGSTDGTGTRFGLFGSSDLPDTVIDNTFYEEITFTTSSPAYSVYRITVINESGNRINRNYEFLFPSGKQG